MTRSMMSNGILHLLFQPCLSPFVEAVLALRDAVAWELILNGVLDAEPRKSLDDSITEAVGGSLTDNPRLKSQICNAYYMKMRYLGSVGRYLEEHSQVASVNEREVARRGGRRSRKPRETARQPAEEALARSPALSASENAEALSPRGRGRRRRCNAPRPWIGVSPGPRPPSWLNDSGSQDAGCAEAQEDVECGLQ